MLVVVLVGGRVSARADTTTALPITGLSAIVVDDAHQQVFLTGDAGDGVVLVTDTTAHVTKMFSGEAGAAGMVLDGGTLYVARCGTTTIDMIDAASLTKSGSIVVSQAIGSPCDLAKAGGRLWFNSSDHLVSVTLDAAHTVTAPSRTPQAGYCRPPRERRGCCWQIAARSNMARCSTSTTSLDRDRSY